MPRTTVLGTELALTDYEGAMDWMDEVVRRRERACVTAAAVHLVMVAREDPETRARRRRRASPSPTACRSCGRCARSGTATRRASTAPT